MILLDTNVLVYAINSYMPQHLSSLGVVTAALGGQVPGVLVPQVVLEFVSVVTHPRRTRRPLDPARAWEQVMRLRAGLPVLEVRPAALAAMDRLVPDHRPVGRAIFDLFLVAQMRSHGVASICTYNVRDFDRLPGVEALTPEEVLARYEIPPEPDQ